MWSWNGWLEPGSSGVPGPTVLVDINDLAGNGFQFLVLWWRFSQSCLAAVGNMPLEVFLHHYTVPDLHCLPLLPLAFPSPVNFCVYRSIRAPPPTVHHASHWHIRHLAVPHTGRVSWHWTQRYSDMLSSLLLAVRSTLCLKVDKIDQSDNTSLTPFWIPIPV